MSASFESLSRHDAGPNIPCWKPNPREVSDLLFSLSSLSLQGYYGYLDVLKAATNRHASLPTVSSSQPRSQSQSHSRQHQDQDGPLHHNQQGRRAASARSIVNLEAAYIACSAAREVVCGRQEIAVRLNPETLWLDEEYAKGVKSVLTEFDSTLGMLFPTLEKFVELLLEAQKQVVLDDEGENGHVPTSISFRNSTSNAFKMDLLLNTYTRWKMFSAAGPAASVRWTELYETMCEILKAADQNNWSLPAGLRHMIDSLLAPAAALEKSLTIDLLHDLVHDHSVVEMDVAGLLIAAVMLQLISLDDIIENPLVLVFDPQTEYQRRNDLDVLMMPHRYGNIIAELRVFSTGRGRRVHPESYESMRLCALIMVLEEQWGVVG